MKLLANVEMDTKPIIDKQLFVYIGNKKYRLQEVHPVDEGNTASE